MSKPSRTKSRQGLSTAAVTQADVAEVQEILALGSLRAEERRVRVHTFRPEELATDSSFWVKAFNGMQLRCMSPLPKKPDLIVGATEEEFVLCLRQGLSAEQRAVLLRHGAAHIALGHIRLGDRDIHADSLEQLQSRPTRRWDAQVEALLSRLEAVRQPGFAVQGLTEALERLVSGDLDPAMASALLLLRNYADELVEVPEALNERAHLFPHQQRGLAELTACLRRFNVAILADSVGLGKTRLACALVRTLKNTGQLPRAAIVTPRKLERNWRKEMAVVSLEEGEDVVLVNKDMLKRWTPEESARVFKGCGLVIVEEAHQDLRNPGNRFHRNLRDGVGLAQGLLVTATPWNNRRGDIFAILSPFVRPAPGAGDGAFQCFKKGFRTGRREFEESDEVFRKVYELTVLQRTRRQLRELGDAGVFYAPRAPSLDVVPYSAEHQQVFRKLLGVVEALRLPYFNPVRFLTGERDAEWRLSGTHRFFLLKRAESSMAAFRVTLQGMQERSKRLREELQNVEDHEEAMARWIAGTYRIAEDVVEATLDASLEGGLLEERVTRPRQRRILRLIEEARVKGRLRALRKRLFADCDADIQLLHDVERDFQDLFTADPKLGLVQSLVGEHIGEHRKVLLVSQFADTAFAVYRVLCAHERVAGSGIGLVMSTAKGGEAPVQVNRREATRDEVLRRFAPQAWAQNAIESGVASGRNGTSAIDEISVLVGTDTISVGQNLQDARTILHLDLTWNPMVLEQRIGRLDRPRHESDNEPIEIRYFLNLDLIEAELQLKKKIEARLEATYRDTAFDDEILPGYFELIEKMRQLRAERADAAEIAREVDALVEELAATRPAEVSSNGAEARRVALERLRETCAGMPVLDPLPPLSVTLGTSGSGRIECAAQVEFQALDNNEHPIGPPESRLVWLRQEGTTVTSGMEDLPVIVEVVLSPERQERLPTGDAQKALEMLHLAVQRFATAIKEERNRLREKRREVIERTRPPWLGPLVRKLRGFLERLPEEQYIAFLTRWEITDEGLSRWLDALTTGIDLDDADLVEQVRQLETAPAAILDAYGVVRDAVPSDEDTGTPSVQLELALEPVVHRVEARVRSLRINMPTPQPVPGTSRLSRRKAGSSDKQNLK
jgi:hypothetical protein